MIIPLLSFITLQYVEIWLIPPYYALKSIPVKIYQSENSTNGKLMFSTYYGGGAVLCVKNMVRGGDLQQRALSFVLI